MTPPEGKTSEPAAVSGQNVRDEDQVSGIEPPAVVDAPDAAVAVPVATLRALVKHARDTGADDIADLFQL